VESNVNEVYFERVFNLGNYETCRIGLRATVTDENGVAKTLIALDRATVRYRKSMEN
jgi:Lhr-like helicase